MTAATGGTTYTFGSYTIHKFTSSDDFVVTEAGYVDVLVVAGGGGGGSRQGGGGGAGGLIWEETFAVAAETISVTVGGGGAGATSGGRGANGEDSVFDILTADGGGGGGGRTTNNTGSAGGSGGGGAVSSSGGTGTAGQGYAGGAGVGGNSAGGGGGASEVGANGTGNNLTGGAGGDGLDYSTQFGTSVGETGYFAGGGGGGSYDNLTDSAGGLGGGGDGASANSTATMKAGEAGTANTGGGGGGSTDDGNAGGAGGSGVVLVRYSTAGVLSVSTNAATEVNSRSAILQGLLTDLGGEASLSVYFEYGTTTSYGSTTDALTLSAIGNFSAKITDFDESATYHFRAVASDGVTAHNGADQSLTTLACPFQLTGTPSLESIFWSWIHPTWTITIVNPGAETGDITGWTAEEGILRVESGVDPYPQPYAGSYYFAGGVCNYHLASQEIDLLAQNVPEAIIDAGTLFFKFWGKQASFHSDTSQLKIRFKNSAKTTISEHGSGMIAVTPYLSWDDVSVEQAIPANTRYVDLIQECQILEGIYTDGYFDVLQAQVTTGATS